jgi:raffinose/stachyose/melibiose transport system permease protein
VRNRVIADDPAPEDGMKVMRHVVLWTAATLGVVPLVWTLYTALKTDSAINDSVWALPTSPTVTNFAAVGRSEEFVPGLINSALVTIVAVAVLLALAALAGYAFAHFDFTGKKVLWLLLMAGLFLPVHATLVPLYQIEAALKISSSWLSLVYLGAVYTAFNMSFSVFYLRGFFAQIPKELIEAATIDGCSSLRVFTRIMLPLSLPALTVVALVDMVMIWNEFVFALVLIRKQAFMTLPLAVMNFADDTGLNIPQTCAALTLAIAPVVVVFLFAQRRIISGLTEGAVRG